MMERFRRIWWWALFGSALPVSAVIALMLLPDYPLPAAVAVAAWFAFVAGSNRLLFVVHHRRWRASQAAYQRAREQADLAQIMRSL